MFPSLFLLLLLLTHPATSARTNPPPPPDSAKPQPCADAKTRPAANECFAKLYVDTDAQLNLTYNKVIDAMKSLSTEAQRSNNPSQIVHHQAAMDRRLARLAKLPRPQLRLRKFQYEGGSLSPTIW
jgi:uncharacterized protein YecT (DUF1311 family)